MKKIALGDLGEFWYGDYKEPFEQLEGAVPGYPAGVVLKDDEGKLLCAYCGKTYDNLGRHAVSHGLTARTYKQEVGLLQKSALVSESERQARIRRAIQGNHKAYLSSDAGVKKGDKRPDMAGRQSGRWTLEHLNKTGRCYAQVLAVARQIAREHRTVTSERMRRAGVSYRLVETYFGGFDRLNDLVNGKRTRHGRVYTDDELLTALKAVAVKEGRTPAASDLSRYGLPWAPTYVRRFGSYPEACRRAGLTPLRLPIPPDFEVQVLNLYAMLGDTTLVAQQLHRHHKPIANVLRRYGIVLGNGWRTPASLRERERLKAAEIARRLAGWPEEPAA